MKELTWLGIIFCLSQSAMFSGLNLALFSISRLKLELLSKQGNKYAMKILESRRDSNYLLTTILWGNVSVNVLLALLSSSVMTGLASFIFSTFVITIFGEILPQAYFSKYALKVGYFLLPVLKLYQILLYPIAKPTSLALDKILGKEAIQFFKERDVEELLKMHMVTKKSDVGSVEATGALNFLRIDDLELLEEGEIVDPRSVIELKFNKGAPVFPEMKFSMQDSFFKKLYESGEKWIIFTDSNDTPKLVLHTDRLLREMATKDKGINLKKFCFQPLVIQNPKTKLGEVITKFEVNAKHSEDDLLDKDVILLWSKEKRIITGSDILGRLLRGIVSKK